MGAQQPFIYSAARLDDARFPATSFDPKAITRSSWEPQPRIPKREEGPLVAFGRHPDAHEVRLPRAPFKTFGPQIKWWIKWTRVVQLGLRVLELIAAAGILFLFVIISNVDALTAWVMRVVAGVVFAHCVYGIGHLARPAAAKTPGSVAGYQIFSSMTDLAVLPLYSFGALCCHNSGGQWSTLLSDKSLKNYFLPSLYYTLIGGAVLHSISFGIGVWLAIKFRQITRMPPDCNPLEDNLTSRHHKRNRSSVATTTSLLGEEKRLTSPLKDSRYGMPYDDLERPPAVPFHATRPSPRSSIGSSGDIAGRPYHITPESSPQRSSRSLAQAADIKRASAPPSSSHSGKPPTPPQRSPWRSSYTGVPTNDNDHSRTSYAGAAGEFPVSPRTQGHHSRPSTGTVVSQQPVIKKAPPRQSVEIRPGRYTEAWSTTDSLVNRKMSAAEKAAKRKTVQGYEALGRPYDLSDSDDGSDFGDDVNRGYSYRRNLMSPGEDEVGGNDGDLGSLLPNPLHPSPLHSNPPPLNVPGAAGRVGYRRPKTPSINRKSTALAEIDLNDGRVSGRNDDNDRRGAGADVADQGKPAPNYGGLKARLGKRATWGGPRNRDSSIQPESDFFAKPYGDLKSATPPMMVGTNRQVSSGNDYDFSAIGGGGAAKRYFSSGKRNVSGKVAEEGRVY
ncbi:hypothetical protein VPNG_06029 [Cytospora leucostoma]|uniref:Uncharacterized protein n=1 Tax=Cytospora leucostoma TaxID=1230097 RepID=A0A423WX11_9PEZI|nr:hypothetical protein VPNG_06029 [Cytospora leucostoma]